MKNFWILCLGSLAIGGVGHAFELGFNIDLDYWQGGLMGLFAYHMVSKSDAERQTVK